MPHFDPVVVTDVYSGMMGAVGVLLLLFGQRAWRIFLYIIAFSAGGGTCGYLLLYTTTGLQAWAAVLIACCVGFASAVVAHFFRMVGLVAIAALAGFILTAMPLRLFIPSLHAPYRLTFLGLGTALGALLTGIGLYQYRRSRAEADEPTAAYTNSPSVARSLLRAKLAKKLLEAIVTSTVGSYAVVWCINQWWYRKATPGGVPPCHSLQFAALLNSSGPLPPCPATPCVTTICVGFGLLVLGFSFQSAGLCRAYFTRVDEHLARTPLREPLTDLRSSTERGPGRATALATRMRQKYCGGAEESNAGMPPITGVRPESGRPVPSLGGLATRGRRASGTTAALASPAPITGIAQPSQASHVTDAPGESSLVPSWARGTATGTGTGTGGAVATPQQATPQGVEEEEDPNLPAWARGR